MERAKGNTAGAISLLQKYLDTNQMDKDAWEELADLYLQVQSCTFFILQLLHAFHPTAPWPSLYSGTVVY